MDSMAQAQRLAGGRDNNTLFLVAEFERQRGVDLGKKGFSTGDFFVFTETIYNGSGGKVIGKDTVRCEAGIRSFTCEATIKLNGRGKIRVAGALFSSERGITLPVTGGTKDFSEAGGQFKVFELEGDRALFVIELER